MSGKTLVARALSLAVSGAVCAFAVVLPAAAQSSATGNIYGRVAPAAGASVTLLNTDTGLRRVAAVDAAGAFLVTALPTGRYQLELVRDGQPVQRAEVDVVIGQGVEAWFGAAMAQVEVSARRSRIDVSNTNNGAVFTARELARLPVASNLNAIILMAPNTTKGDTAYGNVSSFGGSGVSENAYYINGLPVTNPLTQLGSTDLPFGAIAQATVITGGFGAEFGRSIGGVLNVTTRSGTNHWEVGASASAQPTAWRAKARDIYYATTGSADNVATDGKLYQNRALNTVDVRQGGAYLGGPLLRDKLFMFYALDRSETRQGIPGAAVSTSLARDGWNDTRFVQTRYLAKLDWNVSDNHRLEFTSIGDDTTATLRRYGLNPDGSHNDVKYSERTDRNAGSTGSHSNALKYVGQLSESVSLTALYGQLRNPHATWFDNYDINQPLPSVLSTVAGREPALDAANKYVSAQQFGGDIALPGTDRVNSSRLDLEWKHDAHTLRFGLDRNDIDSTNAGVFSAGGGSWTYRRVAGAARGAATPQLVSLSRLATVADFGGLGAQGYYVTRFQSSSVTAARSAQSAQYIEDRWQVSNKLLLTAGLRNDQYNNTNGDGVRFIDMHKQLAPRLSAAWDVAGDASLKVYGSLGRYFLQLPTQVAARSASRSTYLYQDFTYSDIDQLGQPTGLVPINRPGSPDGELGQAKDPRSVVARGLKPNYQDEITLGFEKVFSAALNFGAKATYRRLGAGIDDACDARPMMAYSARVGLAQKERAYIPCFIFNPGRDATLWLEGHDDAGLAIPGSGRYVTFTAAELGFPTAQRSYRALDLFVEHPLRNGWYGKLNYTWSHSTGNMEGQTNSDTGQLDVATTANWDYPEFMAGANGALPNDRTHQLKAYGFYALTPAWSVGAYALLQSGRSKVCIGTDKAAEAGDKSQYGAAYGGPGYGNVYMFCDGVQVPRGSIGRLPLEKRLDLNLVYAPAQLRGLSVKLDLFNAFNTQGVLTREETWDDGSAAVQASYNRDKTYQPPRSLRLTVEYKHQFR